MNCRRAQRYMLLEASGELGRSARERLNRHRANCPACEAWQRDAALLEEQTRASTPPPSMRIQAARIHALATARHPVTAGRFEQAWERLPRFAAAAAALAILTWAALAVFMRPGIQIDVAVHPGNDHVAEWAAILTLTGGGWDEAEAADGWDVDAVARALLQFEGMEAGVAAEPEPVNQSEEHPPITFQWHSIPALQARICG